MIYFEIILKYSIIKSKILSRFIIATDAEISLRYPNPSATARPDLDIIRSYVEQMMKNF